MDKVCPVVLRPGRKVLAFRHPQAGLQLVKGGIEADEAPAAAATRELYEEAGLSLLPARDLGRSQRIVSGDTWQFWLMAHSGLPEAWDHHTEDDGGHRFTFFWHPIGTTPPPDFAPPFVRALDHIAAAIP